MRQDIHANTGGGPEAGPKSAKARMDRAPFGPRYAGVLLSPKPCLAPRTCIGRPNRSMNPRAAVMS